jgi:hypothetical protein
MRTPARSVVVLLAALAASAPFAARAQVSDSERAAARDLFRQGDELQHAGKYSDALDRFQRAQQAFSAPTNVLRIGQCQAALGQIVEATESYRAVTRTVLAAGSPPAFQTALDQAKTELAQLEPRVPHLLVQLSPSRATNAQMWLDGTSVSVALVGEPIPLDPGMHHVRVSAPGWTTFDQDAVLRERETTPVSAVLRALPAIPSPPPLAGPPASTAAGTTTNGSAGAAGPPPPPSAPLPALPPVSRGPAPLAEPPPPPVYSAQPGSEPGAPTAPSRSSRTGLLLGAHLGWELTGGKLPLADAQTVDTSVVANQGFAYALDVSLRFARQVIITVTLEHANLSHGDLSSRGSTDASGSTTLLGATLGFVTNPDRVSFYGEIGGGSRWLSVSETAGTTTNTDYNSGELTFGIGLWLPLGRSVRLLPKATLGLGTFSDPSGAGSGSPQGHTFAMIGLTGFYNLDF